MAPQPATGDRTDGTVLARLRGLDQPSLTALVADLWSARGFDTTREEGVVVATDGDEAVVVAPVAAPRFGSPDPPDRAVDVVVAPAGTPAWLSGDTDVLDAADLADMLRYAVPPAASDELFETHLGGTPDELAAPLSTRLRETLSAHAARAATAVLVLALLAFATVASLSGGSGVTGSATPTGSPTATATPAEAVGLGTVPGLDEDGLSDLTALAEAHRSVLAGQSFTVWADVYRPRGGDPNATRIQRDVDVRVDGDRYLATTTIKGDGPDEKTREVYDDGEQTYVANWSDEWVTVRKARPAELPLPVFGRPAEFRRGLVSAFLQVRTSRITASVVEDGRQVYRLEGEGSPRTRSGVSNYEVMAMVDERGFVRQLTATFKQVTVEGPYRVRLEVTFDRVGTTSVDPPGWYHRSVNGGDVNGSVGDAGLAVGTSVPAGPAGPTGVGQGPGAAAATTAAAFAPGTEPAPRPPGPASGAAATDRRPLLGGGVAVSDPSPFRAPRERELLFSSRR